MTVLDHLQRYRDFNAIGVLLMELEGQSITLIEARQYRQRDFLDFYNLILLSTLEFLGVHTNVERLLSKKKAEIEKAVASIGF